MSPTPCPGSWAAPGCERWCAPLPPSASRRERSRDLPRLVPLQSLPVHLRPWSFHTVCLSAFPVSSWVSSALGYKLPCSGSPASLPRTEVQLGKRLRVGSAASKTGRHVLIPAQLPRRTQPLRGWLPLSGAERQGHLRFPDEGRQWGSPISVTGLGLSLSVCPSRRLRPFSCPVGV